MTAFGALRKLRKNDASNDQITRQRHLLRRLEASAEATIELCARVRKGVWRIVRDDQMASSKQKPDSAASLV